LTSQDPILHQHSTAQHSKVPFTSASIQSCITLLFSINSLHFQLSLFNNLHFTTNKLQTIAMASTTFTSTQSIVLFGRGGYNGPAEGEDDDSHSSSQPMNFGRGGYNRGPDDDDEEDGRGGYN
jgi:hypothetical protein